METDFLNNPKFLCSKLKDSDTCLTILKLEKFSVKYKYYNGCINSANYFRVRSKYPDKLSEIKKKIDQVLQNTSKSDSLNQYIKSKLNSEYHRFIDTNVNTNTEAVNNDVLTNTIIHNLNIGLDQYNKLLNIYNNAKVFGYHTQYTKSLMMAKSKLSRLIWIAPKSEKINEYIRDHEYLL